MKILSKASINSLGLFFDIFSGILIFKYGLPPKNVRRGKTLHLLLEQEKNEKEQKKEGKYDFLANIGLILLIFGFCLQFVSGFLPD